MEQGSKLDFSAGHTPIEESPASAEGKTQTMHVVILGDEHFRESGTRTNFVFLEGSTIHLCKRSQQPVFQFHQESSEGRNILFVAN